MLRLSDLTVASVDLVLPSWVPGAYKIQDQAKFLRGARAHSSTADADLSVERVGKARWRVSTQDVPEAEIRYEVYAHALLVDAVDLTHDHFWLNAGMCLPYVEGHDREAYELSFDIPPTWKVYTDLREVSRTPPRFRAANYDELVDSPVDCGRPAELVTQVRGAPHRLVVCGEGGNYDSQALPDAIRRMAEAGMRLFGDEAPRPYSFFIHLNDVRDGGIEHRNSNACVIERNSFQPLSNYRRLLTLFAHEYLHRYLVKGIRPRALGPFDYEREVYTQLLWLMEGTTEYYGELVIRRAGLVPTTYLLKRLSEGVSEYLQLPGRHVRSLEEASFLAWIDLYQPTEDTPNSSVSYYLKGSLVSLTLDLELRHRTENQRSLDDVMRYLWREYGRTGRPIEESSFPALVESATGADIKDFHRRFIAGTDEIDFVATLHRAGVKLTPQSAPEEDDSAEVPGYLGVRLATDEGRGRIRSVLDGGPAQRAGLSAGDELLAFDGTRVELSRLDAWLKRYPPGTTVEAAYFSRGRLRTTSLTLGRPPPPGFRTPLVEHPTPLQKSIYTSWTAEEWPASPPVTEP